MFRLIVFASFIVFSVTACVQGDSNVERGNRTQVLHIGNNAEPQGLDPHQVTGVNESYIVLALFEGLVSKHPATLEIQPGVAESWTVSDDGRVYTFSLRQNAKWSNGDAVTAHDFVWSWWRGLQPALGNQYVFMYFPIKNAERFFNGEVSDFSKVGVTAIDDFTLRVELANPTPYFLQLLDHYSTFPVHRATIEKWGEPDESYTRWTRPQNMVTNGPFELDDWRLNKHLIVRKSQTYWGADKVRLNKIVFYPYEVGPNEERLYRAGQLHYTSETSIDRLPWYYENKPHHVSIAPYAGTYIYRINNKKPHLKDKRVRQALAMSIDRETLIRTVLNGLFTPAYSIVPPGLLGYQPPQVFAYDPSAARNLLAQAGYPNGKGLPEIELQYNSSEQHRKIAIAIQQMWNKELGIKVRLQNKDWKVYLDDEATGNYEISRGSWIADYVDPNTFLDMWVSDSGINRTGWANPNFDKLVLKDAPSAKTRKARYKHFYDAETLLISDMPFIPIYTYSSHHFIHPSVNGMPPNIMNYYNWRYVYLDADWRAEPK